MSVLGALLHHVAPGLVHLREAAALLGHLRQDVGAGEDGLQVLPRGLAAQPVLVQQGDGGQLSKVLVGTYYLVSIYYNPDSGPGVKKSKPNFFSKNVNQTFL